MQSTYIKFKERDSFNYALESVEIAIEKEGNYCKQANIILGGVAPKLLRASQAEILLQEQELTDDLAQAVVLNILDEAVPLNGNQYKIDIVKSLVTKAIMEIQKKNNVNTGIENTLIY